MQASSDRICAACRARCPKGYFERHACNADGDRLCEECGMDKSFYCDGVTRRKVKDGYYTSGGKTITATLVTPPCALPCNPCALPCK